MKLLESTKSKNVENGENVPNLKITEVVLVHLMLLTMIISKL